MDYGNIEIVSELYQWDPVCETIPFQAIALNISGMEELQRFIRLVKSNCDYDDYSSTKRIEEFLWDRLYCHLNAKVM